MTQWMRQHWFAASLGVKHLLRAPGSFALNILVVAIAFSLPFAGLTMLENMRPVSEQLAVEPEISIFMTMDTPRERATALAPQIHRLVQDAGSTGKLEFVGRERALNALKNKTGLSDALATLGDNPLPDGYVLRLGGFQNAADASRVDTLAAQLKALAGVEYVQVDSAWVKRLAALMQILRFALLFLGVTLGVVVVAVIFNTIRLQVMTQLEEIEVSRLFGATDAYIARPFYYSGILLGLLAGLTALSVVALSLPPLNGAIADFARLYASEFRLVPLDPLSMLTLLATSAALGMAGAFFSVRQHLSRFP